MDNLAESKIRDTITSIFNGVEALANTKKVIGEPYTIGETTIIPFIETSVGLGVGDLKNDKEAAGAGCKVKPVACLIIQDGFTKLINIENQDAITKALDMIPDLVDKLLHKGKYDEKITEKIEEIREDYDD